MKRLANLSLLSTGLVLALFACRGGGDGDDTQGDDMPMPDAPPGGSVKVKDVQSDAMAKGTVVELRGVVVTAIDTYGDRTGDFFVQDAEGGAFSGIKVFGAPVDQVAALQVGDIVDITNAEKEEFALMADMTGRTVTELKGAAGGMMTVTKKGTGTVPAPEVVDAKMIATLDKTAREAEWEKWEGVLIKVVNARQLAELRTFGSNPGPDSTEYRITGIARVQSALAELNGDAAFGVCYESITGVGDYFFNDLLHPRATSDIVTGGTDCNPMAMSISEAQTGTNVELAKLTDVYVAAISRNKKNLWLTTSLTAAPNQGIYVFRGNNMQTTELPADVVVGAQVTVTGAVVEHNNDMMGDTATQLSDATITVTAAPTATPVPAVGPDAATLTVAASGEPYESVLVTLTNVKVTTAPNNFGVGQMQQGSTTFLFDDDIFQTAAGELNKCYASITGVWTYQVFDNGYGLLPIAAGTGTGNCN